MSLDLDVTRHVDKCRLISIFTVHSESTKHLQRSVAAAAYQLIATSDAPATMSERTVFISYRRDEVGPARAGRLSDALRSNGFDAFLDVDSASSGHWMQNIVHQVSSRAHFILLLTPGCLDRCTDENDVVRREYELALQTQRNIVPVAQNAEELIRIRDSAPSSMESVFDLQVAFVADASFGSDVLRLTKDFIPRHRAPLPLQALNVATPQVVVDADVLKARSPGFLHPTLPYLHLILPMLLIGSLILALTVGGATAISIPITGSLHIIWVLSQMPAHERAVGMIGLVIAVLGLTILIKLLGERGESAQSTWPRAEWTTALFALGFSGGIAFAILARGKRAG